MTEMGGERGHSLVPQPGQTELFPRASLTNEGSADGSGWQRVRHNDQEDGVAQEECDLKGDSFATVWGQVEAHDVHDHEEDTGQQQADHIE